MTDRVEPGMTTDPNDPRLRQPNEGDQRQHAVHLVLSQEERAKGYVRPLRTRYCHDTCGGVTRMPVPIAETYARQPDYYGRTFCTTCGDYFPVGIHGEFTWLDERGRDTGERVGT